MRITRTLVFILVTFSSLNSGYCANLDTLANWQIYYADELITAGHENILNQETGILKLTDRSEKLQIFYRYDSEKPEWRTIKIVTESDTLYNATQYLKDNHPHLIELNELIRNRKGTFEIKIYYTDNITTEADRLIGTIKLET